mmetsp:Transcript_5993/g.14890  ORF Transcript_5993/g.14890 Transcript_5993/m.14890 type:complete len:121 (-) Transcript_5993:653-1015(-)
MPECLPPPDAVRQSAGGSPHLLSPPPTFSCITTSCKPEWPYGKQHTQLPQPLPSPHTLSPRAAHRPAGRGPAGAPPPPSPIRPPPLLEPPGLTPGVTTAPFMSTVYTTVATPTPTNMEQS